VAARVSEGAEVTLELLKHCAQAQLRADMEEYSVKSNIQLTLEDLVLPEKEKALIREFLDACINRVFVMSKWGFGRRLVTGKGITALFKGEPGTGKTLCAEILARELGMRLYQISIPKIVSKYIGETEKNISRIFQTARANHSMLLFDEADALFTKRVSVENAIDRFSNMEVNLLLQEIERFEGITILTTNLDKNIDDAFSRRIQFKIEFPFPEPDHRSLIWKGLIPKECPVDAGIDFVDLGEAYELSGGFIKNAVVRAAYRAAAKQTSISWADIEFAAEQECKSAGKLFRTSKHDDDW
jgi:SpoVK/Ycf46/Vps4 family AAA+-type ATPase